jgi:sugar fermentation stimulation protein A
MNYETALIEVPFIKRYKRFFADIEIDKGKKDIAHVPNTGSLKGICDQPSTCRVSPASNPERKLKWTLEQVKTEKSWVGVNTQRANTLAREAIEAKIFPHWKTVSNLKSEAKWTKETRFDFYCELNGNEPCYIEVKNVTLARENVALFPDAETTRGQKHLRELMDIKKKGMHAELIFMIQRNDVDFFEPAADIDPEYARLFKEAQTAGVRITAIRVNPEKKGLIIDKSFSVKIRL